MWRLRDLYAAAVRSKRTQAGTINAWIAEWLVAAAEAQAEGAAVPDAPRDPEFDEAAKLCAAAYAQDTPGGGVRLAIKTLGVRLREGDDPLLFPGSMRRLQEAGITARPRTKARP
jgi:hypothetical protein